MSKVSYTSYTTIRNRESTYRQVKNITPNTYVMSKKEIMLKHAAADILDMFENVLDKHGILIPDVERTGDDCEAALYGSTYDTMMDDIVKVLADIGRAARNNPDAVMNEHTF